MIDDIPQDGESGAGSESERAPDRIEADAQAAFEDRERRRAALWAIVEDLTGPPHPVVLKVERGTHLLDACEAAVLVCLRDGLHPGDAWVKLPNGYATVQFVLSVLAVSGEAAA